MIDRLLEKNPRTTRGRKAAEGKLTTVREVGEAWTNGELLKKHGPVNGLRKMSGGYELHCTLNKRAYTMRTRGPNGPLFGDLSIADTTDSDIEKIMGSQPRGGSSTRNHVHRGLKRIHEFAEIPLRLRPIGSNPVHRAYRAPKDPPKLFLFLYPPEVLALLNNERIPLGRRVLYLFAVYFGWRLGTLMAFRWRGIDWKHGTVSVLHQKGHQRLDAEDGDEEQGTPIFFVATPGCVMTVLRAWYEQCGRPDVDELVIRDVCGAEEVWREEHDEAKVIRRDLKASGVTRELLFSEAKNVQPLRFHDLRATFCTWAKRAGKDAAWIKERTGHTPTSNMLDRYTRMAVTLADLSFTPFPDVTGAIPELAPREPAVCLDCAARLASDSLSTSLPTTRRTGANGSNRGSSGQRNEADRGRSRHSGAVEVLAPEMG